MRSVLSSGASDKRKQQLNKSVGLGFFYIKLNPVISDWDFVLLGLYLAQILFHKCAMTFLPKPENKQYYEEQGKKEERDFLKWA